MSNFFLGVDVGSTKTHALVVDETGEVLGFGKGGPGNHECVGYHGFVEAVRMAVHASLLDAGITIHDLHGAGFGISGYDWSSERPVFLNLLNDLGLNCPYEIVNDTCLGLLAGTNRGWGIAVVAGTGCNCWGWTEGRQKIGQVTGAGIEMGEGAGATELVARAIQMTAYEWTRRGPVTSLTTAFVQRAGASGLEDLLEGLVNGRYKLDASAAPLVFDCAERGDVVAREVIHWAGVELGELAKCVIRQLQLEERDFDVVMIGSLFAGGAFLRQPFQESVLELAPGAQFTRLKSSPAVGAAILGIEAAGLQVGDDLRKAMINNFAGVA